jgi:hypothetical protein
VYAKRVGEFESMEEGVSDDSGPVVGTSRLQESADHFGSKDTAELVAQLNRMSTPVGGHAGLDAHVEFSWAATERVIKSRSEEALERRRVPFTFLSLIAKIPR